jgi:small multidrug resistance family-3 protein
MASTIRRTMASFSSDTLPPPLDWSCLRVATLSPYRDESSGRYGMGRLLLIVGLFVLAGLCEIGGGYLVWGWMREHRPVAWALIGALVLAAYGVVAALQPISEFGRVYAAYGGVFIALALLWGVLVDGFRPDRWDLLGASICVVGVLVMVGPPRG